MKQLFFSLLIFAAFAVQAQQPTTLKPQPTPPQAKQDSAVKVFFWVSGRGVQNLTCDRIEEHGDTLFLITKTPSISSEFYIHRTAYHGKKNVKK
jgi:hypothetical protein